MKIDRLAERWSPWWTLTVLIVGVALSFGVMFALSGTLEVLGSAVVVLFGVALTFAVLGIVTGGRATWAFGPAAVVSVFAWMFMVEAAAWPAVMAAVWPILLVAFFAYEIYQSRTHDHGSNPAMHS